MLISINKSKIHRATVTDANLDYEGSITIDSDLMKAADIVAYEKVQIANITNGERLETYVMKGEPGSGTICINGAAARKCRKGDLIIIISYGLIDKKEAGSYKPRIVKVDGNNKII